MSSSLRPGGCARPRLHGLRPLAAAGLLGSLLAALPPALAAKAEPATAAAPPHAAPAGASDTKPQTRMARCSADFKATGRPGAERKAFMSQCLRKSPAEPAGKP